MNERRDGFRVRRRDYFFFSPLKNPTAMPQKPLKVLLADKHPEELPAALAAAGCEVTALPDHTPDTLRAQIADKDALVVRSAARVNAALLDAAPGLKLVARGGSGTEHIDKAELARRGVRFVATPEGNAPAVGEHAVALLLAALNRLPAQHAAAAELNWRRAAFRGEEIGGKTVGIWGYGHTGRAFARCLSGFGARVLAWDKYLADYGDAYAEAAAPERLFAEAEVVSLHVPLTDETRGLADTAFFRSFARPVWFLNTARGGCLRPAALLQALAEGRVRGAGLDVYPEEPFSRMDEAGQYELAALAREPTVALTHHTAGLKKEAESRITARIVEEVGKLREANG